MNNINSLDVRYGEEIYISRLCKKKYIYILQYEELRPFTRK